MRILLESLADAINRHLGPAIVGILSVLGLRPSDVVVPVSTTFVVEFLLASLLLSFFLSVRLSIRIENPGTLQLLAETLHEFVEEQAESIMGGRFRPYMAYLSAIFLFIVLCNLIGLIPGVETPTSHVEVCLALALSTFAFTEVVGLRKQGLWKYFKHLAGPIWWLSPLIFPVEVVSHLNRNLSLTIRLWANMLASELLTLVFFSMFPVGLPVVFLGLHFAVAIFQGYIFMILTLLYLAEANGEGANH